MKQKELSFMAATGIETIKQTYLAMNANYRLRGKNSKYDLVIATSQISKKL